MTKEADVRAEQVSFGGVAIKFVILQGAQDGRDICPVFIKGAGPDDNII